MLKDNPSEKYSFNTCMWFVYGALLKQGSTVSPISREKITHSKSHKKICN